MPIKCGLGFLAVNLANDIFNKGIRLVVGHRPGLGCRYVGSVPDHIDIVSVFGFQGEVICFNESQGVFQS